MKLTKQKISELSLDPSNVRKHGRKNLDAIKSSLRKFGQQKPIIVDAKGIVIAGNGTLTAAQELGWTEIDIIRTELEGVEATMFAIADNRTAELAEWEDHLGDVLKSLANAGEDLGGLGYDQKELDDLLGQNMSEVSSEERGSTPADEIENYQNSTVRQIVLILDVSEYEEIVAKLEAIKTKFNLENNTLAALEAIRNYANSLDTEKEN
jgi:ParB-like chromosome segregation protein Spo0J